MVSRRLSMGAVIVAALVSFPLAAQAQDSAPDPVLIAQRCVANVTAKADQCVDDNHQAARRAVTAIEDLLANGQHHQAKHVAYRATMKVVETSNDCVGQIHRLCRKCVRVLHRLGADDLARRVHSACHDQIDRVRRSKAVAIQAIRAALAQGSDDGDAG